MAGPGTTLRGFATRCGGAGPVLHIVPFAEVG
jgi:hypothetical protein